MRASTPSSHSFSSTPSEQLSNPTLRAHASCKSRAKKEVITTSQCNRLAKFIYIVSTLDKDLKMVETASECHV